MSLNTKSRMVAGSSLLFLAVFLAVVQRESRGQGEEQKREPVITEANAACVKCHQTNAPALVKDWGGSRHAQLGVGCIDCHQAEKGDSDAWTHEGALISALVTPKDCARCHAKQYGEFSKSHHARGGEILATLDNILAERVAGMPGNNADAVNGCWQCHGSIIKFKRDDKGQILRAGTENKPVIDPNTWPNSGIGRLNPDGSKGSCHACHSRHRFQAKVARSPENCGKCHMGPAHPQIEVYNESKHGIAFYANRDEMALAKPGDWILGRDYWAAPTCATCHISGHMTPQGINSGNNHDVGERISWTLRPVISTRINRILFEDGFKEDWPETRELPKIGDKIETTETVVINETLVNRKVARSVKSILTWQERRKKMKGVCLNCHNDTYVDNFYKQFDDLVILYNEKFARPAQEFMKRLTADKILNPAAPFEHEVQWVFFELWRHEGRRARHGAAMMGPDYTHWQGMYEVSQHYYQKFLPEVIKAAATKGWELEQKYKKLVQEHLTKDEHVWQKLLKPEEIEALKKTYEERYDDVFNY